MSSSTVPALVPACLPPTSDHGSHGCWISWPSTSRPSLNIAHPAPLAATPSEAVARLQLRSSHQCAGSQKDSLMLDMLLAVPSQYLSWSSAWWSKWTVMVGVEQSGEKYKRRHIKRQNQGENLHNSSRYVPLFCPALPLFLTSNSGITPLSTR